MAFDNKEQLSLIHLKFLWNIFKTSNGKQVTKHVDNFVHLSHITI